MGIDFFYGNFKQLKLMGYILIFLATFNTFQKFDNSNMILILIITGICILCYKKISQFNNTKNEIIIVGIYSVLLSTAVILGHEVHYVKMRSSMAENYIDLDISCILTGISLAILIFPILIIIINTIKNNRIIEKNNIDINIKNFFLTSWSIIFISWTPYLLTFYPAGIVGDGALTLEQVLHDGLPTHSHWGVLYILVLKIFIHIGRLFSPDINIAIFIYAVVQSLVYSMVCALVVTKLRKKGVSKLLSCIVIIVYAMSGYFASYSLSLWKDGIFSAAVILFILLLWDYPKEENPPFKYYMKFMAVSLFICFWRSNGMHILLLSIIAIVIILGKNTKKLITTGILVIIFTTVIQGPIYNMVGIEKDSIEQSLSVPLQQIAAVVSEDADSISEKQAEIIYSILPREEWINNYCPTLSDDIKNSVDAEYLQEHLGDFLKVWSELLVPHFSTYVEAYLMQTLGFWQPGEFQGNYSDYWIGIQDIYNRGYHQIDLIQNTTSLSVEDFLESRMQFISSGTMVWLLLFSAVVVLCQERYRRKRILVLAPLIATWMVIMVAAPIAYAYRYIHVLAMAFPIIFLIPFFDNPEYEFKENHLKINKFTKEFYLKVVYILLAVNILCFSVDIASKSHFVDKYKGGQFSINLSGEDYNANDYVMYGISHNEGEFTWTEGDLVRFEIPVNNKFEKLKVNISVIGTFNGEQSYMIEQDDIIVTQGSLNGPGDITFEADVNNGKLRFDLLQPNAENVNKINIESNDTRKLAFKLDEITISE